MVTVGIDQSLSNSPLYKHRCLENINKLYKSSGKCDNQQRYKTILEAEMFSTHYGFNGNSPVSPGFSVTVKNPIARKLLCQFTELFDVKSKSAARRLVDAKSKRELFISVIMLWYTIPNR